MSAAGRLVPGSWLTLLVLLLLLGPPVAVALRGVHAPWWLAFVTPIAFAIVIGLTRRDVPALPLALARRHSVVAALWALLLVVAVVQMTRASLYADDAWQPRYSVEPGSAFRVEHYCMTAYAEAARFALEGRENIYDVRHYTPGFPERRYIGPLTVDPFHYPPPFLLVPASVRLVAPEFFDARRVWFGLQVLMLGAAMLTVARWTGGAVGQRVALAALVVWATPHPFLALQTGNFQITAIPVALLGAVLVTGRHVPLGALLLVFAAAGKVFPSMLVAHVAATRRKWTLVSMAVAAVVLALATAAWFGTAPFVRFVLDEFPRLASGAAFPQTEQPGSAPINASIYGLTTKLRALGASWMDATAGRRVAQGYAVLLAVFAIVSGWRTAPTVIAIRHGHAPGHAATPAGTASRLRLAILWLAILNLASFASPFVGIAYGTVGTVWLMTLLAALGMTPRARAGWLVTVVLATVPVLFVNAPLGAEAPSVQGLLLALAGQVLVIGVNVGAAWVAVRALCAPGPGAAATP